MIITYHIIALLFWIASKVILWKVRSERTALVSSVFLWALFTAESLAYLIIFDMVEAIHIFGPSLAAAFFAVPLIIFLLGTWGYAVYRKSLRLFLRFYFILALFLFVFILPTLLSSYSAAIYRAQHTTIDGFNMASFFFYYPAFYILGAIDIVISGEIINKKRIRQVEMGA